MRRLMRRLFWFSLNSLSLTGLLNLLLGLPRLICSLISLLQDLSGQDKCCGDSCGGSIAMAYAATKASNVAEGSGGGGDDENEATSASRLARLQQTRRSLITKAKGDGGRDKAASLLLHPSNSGGTLNRCLVYLHHLPTNLYTVIGKTEYLHAGGSQQATIVSF
ncbi:unnamed protein product [Protopolystoma xenopodis]|uniref:Uncharacterized protein n=1 Tax=Protopolystoma xenopodis TaxID=117903 RepID=A0A3S5BAJ4_9PLAT|nr:unnamed protein product [Protopolystoma xenopodis]